MISSVFCLPLLRRSLLNKKSSEFPILVKNQNQKGGDSPKRVKSRQIPTLSKNATSGFDSATKVHHFSFFDCCHSHWRSHLDRHFWRSLSFFYCFVSSIHHSSPFLISVSFSLHIMSDLKYLFYIEFIPLNLIYRIFDWCMYVVEIALWFD